MSASSATRDTEHPIPPIGLIATAVGPRQVILAWTPCGQREEGFQVERAAGMGVGLYFERIGETKARITAFRDGSVRPGGAYSYRVRSFHREGVSPPSRVAEVTTPGERSPGSLSAVEE